MFYIEDYVTASRTGEDGNMKLVSFIDLMQDCSQLWMNSEAVFANYFRDNHMAQFLASRQIDIIRIPQYGEKLKTATSIFECQTLYGYRNTVIYDAHNKPCALSWSMGAFVNLETGRMAKVPQEILDTVTIDHRVEMEYIDRKINMPSDNAFCELPIFKVLHNNIDMNKHMNNANYVRIAVECLPQEFKTKRLRIEYKLAAKLGDTICPLILQEDQNKVFVALNNEKGKPYSILEFSA